jgi:hypothetical protein
MKRVIAALTLAALASSTEAGGQSEGPTYRAVVRGMTCKQSAVVRGQLDCDYRVGTAVHFIIVGVGQPDAAITFLSAAGYDADYYVTYGVLHGCVIVKPGGKTTQSRNASDEVPEMAFVSPKSGKVYPSWQTCREAKSAT